ncbi:MAG: hypothetical protein ACTHXA_01955 [Gulosibacter sp.]
MTFDAFTEPEPVKVGAAVEAGEGTPAERVAGVTVDMGLTLPESPTAH